MAVLINFKICDNSKDCMGIKVCPVGAFYWDEENNTIAVHEGKCIQCGLCEKACEVGAIHVAKNPEESGKIQAEIDADQRTVADLFIDRYGAEPVEPAFICPKDKFKIQILESTKLAIAELYTAETIECLAHSIPIRALFEDLDFMYRKVDVSENGELMKTYNIGKLPALLFFKDGKLVGKVEGHYKPEDKMDLLEKIKKILEKNE